ncbi:hypothetical protein HYH03_014097 [Edaphochlamys debaryana]|uniref:Uncharacterized protein n=1 Tax=Edaphochlamys debaryana TaxID=47281 RepID=A0A836BSH8_9CHLO|nr:hypothetical protein HYH03_014097 [Edaphochlamys debaryana]|eukprot:KAG2487255.1 hypothetical protein HYH03_014097 [Edaphochlamys debaryana]
MLALHPYRASGAVNNYTLLAAGQPAAFGFTVAIQQAYDARTVDALKAAETALQATNLAVELSAAAKVAIDAVSLYIHSD